MNLQDVFTAFLAVVSSYFPEEVDPNTRPVDLPQDDVQPFYDFIIIGGGTAGSVVASRLTEIANWTVLVIEDGGQETAITDVPAFFPYLWRSPFDWNYLTVPQKYICKQTQGACEFPRGHALGGSSTINAMLYVRGNRDDYNQWAQMGNTGWSFRDILPYFIRAENATGVRPLASSTTESVDARLRGYNGPLSVSDSPTEPNLIGIVVKAFNDLGFQSGDMNGVNQSRVDDFQKTIRGPLRGSMSRSYLYPARNRSNLNIILNSRVTKILIDGSGRATGVNYVRAVDNSGSLNNFTVNARMEVILAAGAINTPQILMLSGIGPENELETLGINVIKDLPVGRNLQDHLLTSIALELNMTAELTFQRLFSQESFIAYARDRQGPLTFPYVMTGAYRAYNDAPWPNAQFFTAINPSVNDSYQSFVICPALVKPKSVGSVRLQSSSPFDPPLIDPNYLGDIDDRNLFTTLVNDALQLLTTPTLAQYSPRLSQSVVHLCNITNADQIASCVIENFSGTYFHPVGTARMGPDNDTNAVVDGQLFVRGVTRLRVVDASIMPTLINANTNGPVCAIAEKAADIIKAQYGQL